MTDERQPGMGVLLKWLGGRDRGGELLEAAIGKTIESAVLIETPESDANSALAIWFTDGTGIKLSDEGRSCCESRYMRTDDDLSYHTGAKLVSVELRAGEEVQGDYDTHEVEFLIVTTDRGSFTMASHNEHNGYYGGFWIQVSNLVQFEKEP